MYMLANFIFAVARILGMVLSIYTWILFFRVIISWVNPDPYNPIVRFLVQVTEPVLAPIRRYLPLMGIDLSPLIAFAAIMFLQSFLVQSLYDLAYSLR
ncbi:MAG: YggT family protein [Candidatus Omnitrophota bacterium]